MKIPGPWQVTNLSANCCRSLLACGLNGLIHVTLTIDLIRRTLYGGVSFMLPFNQDRQIRLEYIHEQSRTLSSNMKDLFRKCQQHPTANVRWEKEMRLGNHIIVPWGLLENRVPQRSSGLSSFSISHSLPTSKLNSYIKMIQHALSQLAMLSGYPHLRKYELKSADEWMPFPAWHLRHLLRGPGDLNHSLIFGEPGGQRTLTSWWLNQVKSQPPTQNVGIIMNHPKLLRATCLGIHLLGESAMGRMLTEWVISCSGVMFHPFDTKRSNSHGQLESLFITEHRQHQDSTQRNQVSAIKKTTNKHDTGWRQLCAACILNILHAKDRMVDQLTTRRITMQIQQEPHKSNACTYLKDPKSKYMDQYIKIYNNIYGVYSVTSRFSFLFMFIRIKPIDRSQPQSPDLHRWGPSGSSPVSCVPLNTVNIRYVSPNLLQCIVILRVPRFRTSPNGNYYLIYL